MPYQLVPDSPGDFRNAQFLGRACELAYLPEPDGSAAYQGELGLQTRLISVDNTQAYLGQNDSVLVVAFRGSESPTSIDGLKDWLLTNANNFLILPEGDIGTDFAAAGVGARFHKGFMEALAEIWDPLVGALNEALEQKDRPLYVTGHSLGGAIAVLAAWRLQRNFIQVHEVYTFGAPMVGNKPAADAIQDKFPNKIFRFVDDRDLVPRLPMMSLIANEYCHCLTEVPLHVAASGTTVVLNAGQALQEMAGEAVQDLLSGELMDRLWSKVQGGIDAHLMPNYLSQIGQKCNEG